jgi:flagellar biosynthetic protein FliR
MTLRADMAWLTLVLLFSLRVAPLFILAPVLGSAPAPALARAALALGLSAAVVSASGAALDAVPGTLPALLAAAATELVLGAALAFGLAAAFAAFLFAGRLLDLQFGFGIATLVDPSTRAQAPLLGTALHLLAVVLFFVLDGHHMLLRALAFSLERFPPGGSLAALQPEAVAVQFGVVFSAGLAVAAPALLAVLLLDVAFAVASRTMPQMNVFIISIPFKIALGLAMLALSLPFLAPAMRTAFESVFRYWDALLR